MRTRETSKRVETDPGLKSVDTADLRAWLEQLDSPLFAAFRVSLEATRKSAFRTLSSPEKMSSQEAEGRNLSFYQGKLRMIDEVVNFFEKVKNEYKIRQSSLNSAISKTADHVGNRARRDRRQQVK